MAEELSKEVIEQAKELQAKKEASKPKQLELDPYEQLLLDNVLWKEKAARASIEIANRDMADAAGVKNELIKKLKAKHNLTQEWQVTLDQVRKTAVAERK